MHSSWRCFQTLLGRSAFTAETAAASLGLPLMDLNRQRPAQKIVIVEEIRKREKGLSSRTQPCYSKRVRSHFPALPLQVAKSVEAKDKRLSATEMVLTLTTAVRSNSRVCSMNFGGTIMYGCSMPVLGTYFKLRRCITCCSVI